MKHRLKEFMCMDYFLKVWDTRERERKKEFETNIAHNFCFNFFSSVNFDYKLCIGASLDRRSGKLIESRPKVLYEQMPVIYIYAINTTAGKDPRLYECPIYRKPQRTDQKYVGSIDFETDFNPRHWTLRGVALLCDIK